MIRCRMQKIERVRNFLAAAEHHCHIHFNANLCRTDRHKIDNKQNASFTYSFLSAMSPGDAEEWAVDHHHQNNHRQEHQRRAR